MRNYPFDVAANAQDTITVIGRFIRVKSASAEIRIKAEDKDGGLIADLGMDDSDWVALPVEFERIRIENETGSSISGELTVGDGSAASSIISGTVTNTKGQDNSSYSFNLTSAGAAIAAKTTRRVLLIQNMSASDIEYGETGFALGDGIVIKPNGDAMIDESAAAAWGLDTAVAGPLDVRILEELD